ncbi:hypothetical protein [Arthrobacter sp. USHLN218]|uniref:hypothetical protein n=1 Tax=Arthrobacter sp. USHLN218 TaxID=3081232 RepID=UPI0030181928
MTYVHGATSQDAQKLINAARARAAQIILDAEQRAKAADAIVSNARAEAKQIIANANEQAEQITTAATRHAANIKSTARKYARDHQPAQERPLNPLYNQLLQERYGTGKRIA